MNQVLTEVDTLPAQGQDSALPESCTQRPKIGESSLPFNLRGPRVRRVGITGISARQIQRQKPALIYNSSRGISMQVSRWGNSLAVRLPAAVVDALGLEEGDEIELRAAAGQDREFLLARPLTREGAVEGLRRLGWRAPRGWLHREELYER